MYESNSTSLKSVYSYDQYHWCPIALSVRDGFLASSVKYRSRNDGRARNSKIMAGKIVQTVSMYWASNK